MFYETESKTGKMEDKPIPKDTFEKQRICESDEPVNQKREQSSSEEGEDSHFSKFEPYIWHNGVRIAHIRHNWKWPKGIQLQKLTRSEKNFLSSFANWASDWAIYNSDRPNTTHETQNLIESVDLVVGLIASFRTHQEFMLVCDIILCATEDIKDCVIAIRNQPITTKEMEQLSEWADWASSVACLIVPFFERCARSEHIYASIDAILGDIMTCETWSQYDIVNAKKYWLTRVINEYLCVAQRAQQNDFLKNRKIRKVCRSKKKPAKLSNPKAELSLLGPTHLFELIYFH